MSQIEAMMVRVYLSESDHALKRVLTCLHDELEVCGVTVIRGIEGFGGSGRFHAASLIDLSFDLPLIVEFYDRANKVEQAIERIKTLVKPGHIVAWPVTVEAEDTQC